MARKVGQIIARDRRWLIRVYLGRLASNTFTSPYVARGVARTLLSTEEQEKSCYLYSMRDADVRDVLRRKLDTKYGRDAGTIIVEELGLCSGSVRAGHGCGKWEP